MSIPPWLIADNGVRNPYRLKDGLRVIVNSRFHGNLSRENEEGIVRLLSSEGVVTILTDVENTVARKWRLNLIRLGFISDETHRVTPNGQRLLDSTSLPSEEECFLRALLAHQIPSSVHKFANNEIEPFSPLRMVLEVINELGQRNEEPMITKNELASIVILNSDMNQINNLVEEIINYRLLRAESADRNRFDRDYRLTAAANHGKISATSLDNYADVNLRYLKSSGLFAEDGQRLNIAVHKETVFQDILSAPYNPIPENDYIDALESGSSLPTDDESEAIIAIRRIHGLLLDNEEPTIELPNLNALTIQDLSHLRLELENDWIHVLESRFSEDQVNQWEDILVYLNALQNPRRHTRLIPSGEAPAYLEWTIWRSFLAMNLLENPPWESRRFTVDRNFYPVRHAPGGGADMIFEYEDFVIVMEVTLTSSSRQEAAEGEPVRRHVAQYVEEYSQSAKRVYGVFIANNIDTNTAETFRIGVWYHTDDSERALQIVPITLSDYTNLFEAIFRNGHASQAVTIIKSLLLEMLSYGNERAPKWKSRINELIIREAESRYEL